jgi:hypothetical protein
MSVWVMSPRYDSCPADVRGVAGHTLASADPTEAVAAPASLASPRGGRL